MKDKEIKDLIEHILNFDFTKMKDYSEELRGELAHAAYGLNDIACAFSDSPYPPINEITLEDVVCDSDKIYEFIMSHKEAIDAMLFEKYRDLGNKYRSFDYGKHFYYDFKKFFGDKATFRLVGSIAMKGNDCSFEFVDFTLPDGTKETIWLKFHFGQKDWYFRGMEMLEYVKSENPKWKSQVKF